MSRLVPAVPRSFAGILRRRLGMLDSQGRRVLAAAAVLGRRFDWQLVPGIAEVDGKAVVDTLRLAVDEQLVVVDGEQFLFRHALTREAVLDELLPPERAALCGRAVDVVELAHPRVPGPWCELAAELAERAGDVDRAARLLLESARRATARGALRGAEAALEHARTLRISDAQLAFDAGRLLVEVLTLAGKAVRAGEVGASLLVDLGGGATDPRPVASIHLLLARAAITAGIWGEAREHVDHASTALAGVRDDDLAVRVDAAAARVALEEGRIEDAERLAQRAVERAGAAALPDVECEALEVLGRVVRLRDNDAARAVFERAAALAERKGLPVWRLRALHEMAILDMRRGSGVARLVEARQLAGEVGAHESAAAMDLLLADFALQDFDHHTCEEASKRCIEISRRFGLAALPLALLWLAGSHALRARTEDMENAVKQAVDAAPDDPRVLGDAWGRVRATLACVQEDREGLRRVLDASMPPTAPGKPGSSGFSSTPSSRDPWIHRADICRASGRTFVATPEHDGRIVADVVADWARRHGAGFTLVLEGPAGGAYHSGDGGEALRIDAVEFCRVLSGRGASHGLLATWVPF